MWKMVNQTYLDIMSADGTFLCQLRYDKRGFPKMENGKVVERFNRKELEEFEFSKRPSLRGKDIRIETTNQRVYPWSAPTANSGLVPRPTATPVPAVVKSLANANTRR